jgi:Arm DNA-binding domain
VVRFRRLEGRDRQADGVERKRLPPGRHMDCARVVGSGATKRQVKKGGYRTRKEAQAALTELLGSIDAGTFVTPSRLTLRRYLDDWLAGLATAGCRPTTIDRTGA